MRYLTLKITPGFWLFIFCTSMYYLTMGGHLYSADNEIKGLISEAIIERQAFTLPIADMAYMTPGRGGLSFSPFPLGSSITMMPSYLLGNQIAQMFSGIPRTFIIEFCYALINPICTATTCLILYGICQMLGYSLRTSIVTSLIFGFCSIAWPYAKTSWSEPQATLCVLIGLYGLIRYNSTKQIGWIFVGGLSVGYGVLTKLEMAIYVGLLSCLFLYYLFQAKPRTWLQTITPLLAWGIPIVFFIFAILWYNYIRFDQWFAFRHYSEPISSQIGQASSVWLDSLEGILVGTYQHIFSTGKGLLLFSPPMIMYYWAMKLFWKSQRPVAIFCLALPVIFIIVTGSSWIMTKISWGERYFVSLTPFLILPLSALVSKIVDQRSAYMKKSLITFIVLGFCVQILGISVSFQTIIDKMGMAGNEMDIQLLSYDPEYSPVLLHAQDFYARIGDSWKILVYGVDTFLQAQQTAEVITGAISMDIKSNRDLIRFYTYDYWFCYMLLMKMPIYMILLPALALIASVFLSGKRLYRFATA
jgi:hypothetical protein